MDLHIDVETMSEAMQKFHLRGPWPFHPVIHRFSDIDRGDAHDHPWGFTSFVMHGWYTEEVFDRNDGWVEHREHKAGESFFIPAKHIHRIIDLDPAGCWTLILPGPPEQKSGFWDFRPDGPYHRFHDETEWRRA